MVRKTVKALQRILQVLKVCMAILGSYALKGNTSKMNTFGVISETIHTLVANTPSQLVLKNFEVFTNNTGVTRYHGSLLYSGTLFLVAFTS